MASRKGSRVSAVIVVLFGLIFGGIFVGVGFWVLSSTQPLEDGVIVPAEVVDIEIGSDSDGDTTYSPVVEYADPATGELHRLTGSVASSSRPALGTFEEVSLIPGDPSTARVIGPAWIPWIFIAVGGLVLAAILLQVVRALFRRGSSDDSFGSMDDSVFGSQDHSWTLADPPKIIDD